MIDNLIYQQTPEGVELSLMPAGILPRAGAWILDFCIRMGVLYALSLVFGMLGDVGMGLLLISYFLLDWFYPVFFEVFRQGQTIGKKQFGIQVCQDDGTPIRWQASMIRNLLRVADFLPFGYFSAIVSMLFNPSSKRLGDMVAGTLVVYVEDAELGYAIPVATAVALPMPLQLDEQQAILAFAERASQLPRQRANELAEILDGVAGYQRDMPSHIIGYANQIIGQAGQVADAVIQQGQNQQGQNQQGQSTAPARFSS
ncbi:MULTISPECIES: RDD family protein [unclassified Moraxella]|uniref:RDD family protein n=1 Tax=unclassified Moraxella TaxID=2685852 RepID=UPI003AF9C837